MSGYVEDLTDDQRAALDRFRTAVADLHGERTDRFLLRWLRARDFDVCKAESMLRKNAEWRSENRIDSILEEYQAPDLLRRYFPGGVLECGLSGQPLFLFPVGSVDLRRYLPIVSSAAVRRHIVYLFETTEAIKERISLEMGRPIETQYIVFDLEGFSLRQLYSWEVITLLTDLLRMYEENYPEILEKAFVVNAPSFFPLLWRIVRPFLSQRTADKVHIFTRDGWREVLREHFIPEKFPKHWGGDMLGPDGDPRCKDKVYTGVEVPSWLDIGPDSGSRVISIRDTWKLGVPVDQDQSLLLWSFEVQQGELGFTLSYMRLAVDEEVFEEPLTEPKRLSGQHQGSLRCDKPGVYVLEFDNSFSWLTSKNLTYSVEVQSPDQSH